MAYVTVSPPALLGARKNRVSFWEEPGTSCEHVDIPWQHPIDDNLQLILYSAYYQGGQVNSNGARKMELFTRRNRTSHSGRQFPSRETFSEYLRGLIADVLSSKEIEEGLETLDISKDAFLDAAQSELPDHEDEFWNCSESEWREVQRLLDHPVSVRPLDAYGPNLRNIVQSIILLMAVALLIFGFKAQSIFSAVLIGLSIILGGWSGASIARNIYRAEKLRRRYRQQLEASMDAYDAALVERGVLPQIRILLNDLQEEHYYSSRFTVKSAPGLQSDDSRFQVETTGSKNFTRLLGAMADRGGSVGIAGPRGSGKTSLLQAICAGRLPIGGARRRNSPDLFSVLVAAPVEFSSREFLLHFFAKLCEHLISWDTGLRSLASQPSPPKSKGRPKVPVGLIGVLCVIASIVLLLLALPSAQRQKFFRTKVTPALAKLFGHNWNSVKQFVGGMNLRTTLIGIGLLLVGLILCILVIVRMLRTQNARYLENNRPALIKYARDRLQRIRFQLSYSSGWSGTLKLPVVEGGVNEMLSAAENQMSLPDVVAEIKAFLTEITLAVRNIRLVLAIDELDKLESDVKAWQFLNDLKGIFGVPRCLYLVSISEEALSSFELRGFPFRDAFDSAFDEVAHLRQLTYGESRALLRRRVIGLSGPYICLCHCMAGGLPRDLIRVARDLVILRREGQRDSRDLSDITADLIQEDLGVRSAATMIAVSRKSAGLQIGELAAWIDRVQNTRVMTADEILNVCRSYPGVVGPSLSKTETGDGNAQMTETFLEIHQLGFRLCGLLYFSATLIELLQDDLTVTQIDWLEGIGPKSVDRLALARQAFATNAVLAWNKISDFRKNWQFDVLDPSRDWYVFGSPVKGHANGRRGGYWRSRR